MDVPLMLHLPALRVLCVLSGPLSNRIDVEVLSVVAQQVRTPARATLHLRLHGLW
jgi:hypothetical protein